MKYVEMTIEEALLFLRGNKNGKVLVAVQDLQKADCNVEFMPKSNIECEKIIKDGSTIIDTSDDFMKQINIYTERQYLPRIVKSGKKSTMIFV